MSNFGLNQRAIKTITNILAKYPQVEQAIIYGSRVKGNYREGSDIDLTFKGQNLTYDIVKNIWGDLDDSDSPYLFDLSIYDQLNSPNLVKHIDGIGQIFYQRSMLLEQVRAALFGIAVGDALGVPVEFVERDTLQQNPVTDMRSGGTYGLPAGTWSDDSSLTFCLAEALSENLGKGLDLDIDLIAKKSLQWFEEGYWTAYGDVFDIGIATRKALINYALGTPATLSGERSEWDNGNGSLMRILPLVFHLQPIVSPAERFGIQYDVCCITHGHLRSCLACYYYLEFALLILQGKDKQMIYKELQIQLPMILDELEDIQELSHFERLLQNDISLLSEKDIRSSGYVIDTLEAAIWCFMTTDDYRSAVLKAVNLGNDTDTVASITGGLAALYYGFESIPAKWIAQLIRKDDIENLAQKLTAHLTRLYEY